MTAGADLRSDRPGVVLTAGPAPQDWSASADAFGALDAQGCPAIWLTDHLFWGRPMPEALTMAALAASATRRCTVGTGVLQLPLRSTAAVAKAAATVQVLSGGRFVLGVGIGEHEHEYELVGADFHRRGRTLDDGIDELRRLWAGTEPADEWFAQRPAPETIPIWVGGRSPAALARAARCDGWMPVFVTAEQYGRAVAQLDAQLDAAGRGRDEVVRAVTLLAAVAHDRAEADAAAAWCGRLWNLPPSSLQPYLVAGRPEEVRATVETYRRQGAQHVALMVAADDPVAAHAELATAWS